MNGYSNLIRWIGAILLGLTFCTGVVSAQTEKYRTETVSVIMTDGTQLVTDIYLPVEDGNFPTILARTPYGSINKAFLGEFFAAIGYAVVVQNVRGTNGSQGQFFPFAYEREDGLETLDWIEDQGWCNGKIGLWGVSYQGYGAFQMAATGHPALAAMFHNSSWADLQPFMAHGGAFHLMAHLRWFVAYAFQQSGQPVPPEEAWGGIFRTVPLNQFFQGTDAAMDEMVAEGYDYAAVNIPVFHISGWYDYIYPNTLIEYEQLAKHSRKGNAQKLIVGPWAHNGVLGGQTKVGDDEFGPEVKIGIEKTLEMCLQWFDFHMKDIKNDIAKDNPVRIFVMGENRWHEFDTWPPGEVAYQIWHIDASGPANSVEGAGAISRNAPGGSETDKFTFDPENPVPTNGGANSHFFPKNLGAKDQQEIEKRNDVLVYTSEPLEKDLLLVGPIKTILYASTEGKDSDFTAKLVEVGADGTARNVEDGIIRASFRDPANAPQLLEPGKVYKFEIDMGATARLITAGSRLRLEISSSNFPKYDRNPNTGEDPFSATEFVPVEQTIYHSPEYSTHLILPVLPD
jgi:predicted acyl esterase